MLRHSELINIEETSQTDTTSDNGNDDFERDQEVDLRMTKEQEAFIVD